MMLVVVMMVVVMMVMMVVMLWSCHKFSNLEQKVVSYQHDFQIESMREHIICIFENPPLPLSAILQKLNLRLAFIHSHLICLIFTQGRDVVHMSRCFEKLVLVIYSGPREKPKSQIVDLHKCVSSVGLGIELYGWQAPQAHSIPNYFR